MKTLCSLIANVGGRGLRSTRCPPSLDFICYVPPLTSILKKMEYHKSSGKSVEEQQLLDKAKAQLKAEKEERHSSMVKLRLKKQARGPNPLSMKKVRGWVGVGGSRHAVLLSELPFIFPSSCSLFC